MYVPLATFCSLKGRDTGECQKNLYAKYVLPPETVNFGFENSPLLIPSIGIELPISLNRGAIATCPLSKSRTEPPLQVDHHVYTWLSIS